MRAILALISVHLAALAVSTGGAFGQSVENGQTLFETSCLSCHTLGGGDLVGPDLAGISDRQDVESVLDFIVNPTGAMPNLGITPDQAVDIVAFIEAQSGGEGPPPAPAEPQPAPSDPSPAVPPPPPVDPEPVEPAPPPPEGGDPVKGKDLFTGAGRFENDGAPCLSCHQIAGVGALGGGTLGPDLTGAYATFGEGYVVFLMSGTMEPIFDDKPLTAQEEADLGAFLAQASADEPPSDGLATTWFVLIGLGGALILLAVAMVIWRDRLGPVRRDLVRSSSARKE